MSKKLKDQTQDQDLDSVYFVPLGGSEEFGSNLNVYIYQGQYLAIDCGIGFADERFPGIDLLLPDPALLEKKQEALQGLIVTHAHEDHIGAVAYLWERLRCPVYTTPFAAVVLRQKLRDIGIKNVPIHVVNPEEEVQLGAFKVQFIPVAHSIPDTSALVIETKHGKILHSGDWNMDPDPVVGHKTQEALFRKMAGEGVLAYIGDSTNAQVPGRSGSESLVQAGMEAEFKKCKGKVAVTMFSSNIGRIISIARAAEKAGRSVGVIGRSLHRMVGNARECGFLDGIAEFISEEDMGYLPDESLVVLVTGSQGEVRAALSKIARGDFNNFSLNKGDTVIFSSRTIPGNEININKLINALSAGGINIVTAHESQKTIHVSGHPCRDEVADMFAWIKPNLVVPVHGGRVQREAHADIARESQVPHVIVPNNGTLIKLGPGKPEVVDHLETGLLAVDQKRIITSAHASITTRRKLQYTGVLHVSLALDSRGKLAGDIFLDSIGLLDVDAPGEEQIEDNLFAEVEENLDEMTLEERLDDHFVSEELRIALRRFCHHAIGIKPKTTVHVIRV